AHPSSACSDHGSEMTIAGFHRNIASQCSMVERLSSLLDDYRPEALPDHGLAAIHHLGDNVGDAHQLLGLPYRFTRQQTHLLEVAGELWRRRKPAKPPHRKLLSKEPGLTNDGKLRLRHDLVWRGVIPPFPLAHDAISQPAGRSIRKLW